MRVSVSFALALRVQLSLISPAGATLPSDVTFVGAPGAMSDAPSPPKLPAATMRHWPSTLGSSAYLPPQLAPLMNQIDRSPVARFCHTRSALASPSKSAAAAIDQAVE